MRRESFGRVTTKWARAAPTTKIADDADEINSPSTLPNTSKTSENEIWLQQQQSQLQPQSQNSAPNSNPNSSPNSNTNANDETLVFESALVRHELASHLFSEFYHKNLSASLNTNSPAEVIPIAVQPAPNEPSVQFTASSSEAVGGGSGSQSGGGGLSPAGDFFGGHLAPDSTAAPATVMAAANASHEHAPPISASSSGLPPPAPGSSAGPASTAAAAGGRPYFGDAFYSFSVVYWPIHCVLCLAICTLGIFANVTNIIVLTR